MKTVMFDSDQGAKSYRDCVPDYTITDVRDLQHLGDMTGRPRRNGRLAAALAGSIRSLCA